MAAALTCSASPRYTPVQVAAGVGVAATVFAGGVAAVREPEIVEAIAVPAERAWEQLQQVFPPLQSHPKLVLGGSGLLALGAAFMCR